MDPIRGLISTWEREAAVIATFGSGTAITSQTVAGQARARGVGCTHIIVNLFAYRMSYPSQLRTATTT